LHRHDGDFSLAQLENKELAVSDQFVGEIRAFPFNFAPNGWAVCNGQLLAISQNTALFSLLGTQFGGNGTSNFALPNLQGSAPLDFGQGPGLSPRVIGETGGEQAVTLTLVQIPAHTHQATGVAANGNLTTVALAPQGSSLPHDNMPPYLALNFCIALQGIFPARS
jgi:microcystin-dependent protein